MWVKICGIRDVDTARAVAVAGADALGLNFYAPSPRCVSVEVAAEIVRALPASVLPIGLFVNHALAEIRDIVSQTGLRAVQLHGDEPPELLVELGDLKLFRAFRIGAEGLLPVQRYLARCGELGVSLQGCLLDAAVPGQFGGSGHTLDWHHVAAHYEREAWPPLILAGGLTPANIADAIQAVRPWGVDVASGVERVKGMKDLDLVRQFVAAAKAGGPG